MKHVFSRMAPVLVLIAALTFLIGGTASAQSTTSTHQTIVTSAAVPLACPATVQEGSSGSVVKELQRALNGLYLDYSNQYYFENSPDNFKPLLTADGGFGTLTRNAVIDFQTWNSPTYGGTLSVDGIVGPKTWHDLGKC